MKQLTNFAVQSAMDLLIHTNGQTTTLELKNMLRELDFKANQSEVSSIVNEIFNDSDDKYVRENVNGTYNVYKFSDVFKDENDIVDEEDSTTGNDSTPSLVQQMIQDIITDKRFQQTGSSTQTSDMLTVSREPISIYYSEKHARESKTTDETDWVVSHAKGNNEIHIYDSSLTRDQVRSKYASILKEKIQDVRACRFAHY